MALEHTVKHPFVSLKPDGADASFVRPSNWNADHTIVFNCADGVVLGRQPGAAGPVLELTFGAGFSFSGTTVSVPSSIPVGTILDFGGSSAPDGWVLCSGQQLLRSVHSALFAVIGTAFGNGDGSTTFNVPDLRGRATFGRDSMGGSAANRVTMGESNIDGVTLGASGGQQSVTLDLTQVPAHTHTIGTVADHVHAMVNDVVTTGTPSIVAGETIARENTGSGAYSLDGVSTGSATLGDTGAAGGHTHTISAGGGGGESHTNMPPTVMVTKIIFTGVFP